MYDADRGCDVSLFLYWKDKGDKEFAKQVLRPGDYSYFRDLKDYEFCFRNKKYNDFLDKLIARC